MKPYEKKKLAGLPMIPNKDKEKVLEVLCDIKGKEMSERLRVQNFVVEEAIKIGLILGAGGATVAIAGGVVTWKTFRKITGW